MFEGVCEPSVAAVQAADPFQLAAVLAKVSADELGRMSLDEAECVLAATQRIVNAVTARQAVAVTRYTEHIHQAREIERQARAASGAPVPVGQPSAEQQAAAGLAPILRIAPRTMVTRIHTAQALRGLPQTSEMGWAGDLEPYRVGVIARAARQVGYEQLVEFEARLHDRDIRELPGSQVKSRAELIAARLASQPEPTDPNKPDEATEPCAESCPVAPERWVRIGAGEAGGLTHWDAQLPADVSLAMWAGIQALAARYRQGNPNLTVAQARADALVDLVLSDVQVSTTATLIVPAAPAPGSDAAPAPGSDAAPAPSSDAPTSDSSAASADAAASDPAQPRGPADGGDGPAEPAQCAWEPPRDPEVSSHGLAGDPHGELASARTEGATRRREPEPVPGCGRERESPSRSRSPSWLDLLVPVERAGVLLSGPWAQDLPPPVQDRYAAVVARARQVDANPRLARNWHGRIWFVPKPVTSAPVGLLLPQQVAAILADPDTRIRLGSAHPRTGAVDYLEERTYRPGAALARLVRARDGTCRYPGCATPADRCDLDHVIAYPAGSTSPANLHTLCRVHHGFKHHGGWRVSMTPDGVCTWTAPNGRTHTTHPPNLHDDAA